MFKALWRMLRAIGYAITFQFDKVAEAWGSSSGAIAAQYDDIKSHHQKGIRSAKTAIASIMAVQEKKKKRLNELEEDIDKYQRLIAGAQAKGKKVTQALLAAGKSKEAIQADADYVKCKKAVKDFTSTLQAKVDEADSLAVDIEEADQQLAQQKASLQGMVRELKTIDQEKHATIADVEIARQQKEAQEIMAGISTSGTAEQRQRLQDMRNRLKQDAKITAELAGVDEDNAEKEFLDYALETEVDDEFDKLMGLASETTIETVQPKAIEDQSQRTGPVDFTVQQEREKEPARARIPEE